MSVVKRSKVKVTGNTFFDSQVTVDGKPLDCVTAVTLHLSQQTGVWRATVVLDAVEVDVEGELLPDPNLAPAEGASGGAQARRG